MQFKTKVGLVDIPNAEVLAAAREIQGDELATERALFRAECRTTEDFRRQLAEATGRIHSLELALYALESEPAEPKFTIWHPQR